MPVAPGPSLQASTATVDTFTARLPDEKRNCLGLREAGDFVLSRDCQVSNQTHDRHQEKVARLGWPQPKASVGACLREEVADRGTEWSRQNICEPKCENRICSETIVAERHQGNQTAEYENRHQISKLQPLC